MIFSLHFPLLLQNIKALVANFKPEMVILGGDVESSLKCHHVFTLFD